MQRPVKAHERVGPYELLAPVGEGGMGEVWKARDTRLDRNVALKFSKATFEERFRHEARAVAALNHPHICRLYDIGPDYLVMELVEGSPLRGPLPVAKVVTYASQILDAVDAAHRQGIVHRDLKPANILVTPQGIKLLDFGLAKRQPVGPASDNTVTQALTGQGQIVGTLQYMAPEQLQGLPADVRSDIFSFGCVLYETLTGKSAFPGSNPASVIAAILERERRAAPGGSSARTRSQNVSGQGARQPFPECRGPQTKPALGGRAAACGAPAIRPSFPRRPRSLMHHAGTDPGVGLPAHAANACSLPWQDHTPHTGR